MTHRIAKLVASSLVVGCLSLAACNIVAPAVILAKGPPKYPAQFELDPKRPTVIFIDDRASRVRRTALRQMLAQAAEQELMTRRVVEEAQMISSRGALTAANNEHFDSPLSIVEIGRSVQAEVVIYVAVDEFSLSPDGTQFIPGASFRVKVLDAVTGERLWPKEAAGQPVRIEMHQKQGTTPTSRAELILAEEELAAYAGIGLAQLFYTHEVTASHLR